MTLEWHFSTQFVNVHLIRLLRVFGIEEVICPPRRPDKKPYVERCVRTFKHEWLDRFSLNTMADVYEALEGFTHYHNAQRLHQGHACQGKTPDEAFPTLPVLLQIPQIVQSNAWLLADHGRVFRRRVSSGGTVQIDKHKYYIGTNLCKQQVLIHLDAPNRCFWVTNEGKKVKQLEIQGLHPEELDVQDYLLLLQDEARSIEYYRQMVWQRVGEIA